MGLLIAGDFVPSGRFNNFKTIDEWAMALSDVSNIIKDNYSILNLEAPHANPGIDFPARKIGPHLSCNELSIDALSSIGFNCFTLANNHFYDYMDSGVNNTLKKCKSLGVEYVGGGRDIEEAEKTKYVSVDGFKVALINCCEHEFSIASQLRGGSNPLNLVYQYNSIIDAKKNADYVVLIIHGGVEGFQYPTVRMVEQYRFFIDAGADLVVNHHQHCYSGYEEYKGKMIFYGLGNFCFDRGEKTTPSWHEGYMIKLSFAKRNIDWDIYPYIQSKTRPTVELMREEVLQSFLERIKRINDVIMNKEQLMEINKSFMESSRYSYAVLFTPYSGRLLKSLYRKGLIPGFLSKTKLLDLMSAITCESHRERIIDYLVKGADYK